MDDRPTFGSLFAGIGGIDLGLERAGWDCRWQVEWDDWCQHNLGHHWPDVPRHGDITLVDWSDVEPVDLIAGGFPCQPFSTAGKRLGTADERWLWPEFARAVGALRPGYVLVENVPGLLAGHRGMGRVLGDLADLGYDTEWDCIPAAAVGAPHLRYRVFILAYPAGSSRSDGPRLFGRPALVRALAGADGRSEHGHPAEGGSVIRRVAAAGEADVEDTDGGSVESGWGRRGATEAGQPLPDANGDEHQGGPSSDRWQAAADVPANPDDSGRDGRAGELGPGRWGEPSDGRWWSVEPDVGRVAHGVPARVDRLRALGNAVVPQVVEVIGRAMMADYRLTRD